MELKAIKIFRDKANSEKLYEIGETLSVDDLARVNDLVSRGLCEIIADNGNNNGEGNGEESNPPPTGGNGGNLPPIDVTGKVALFEKWFEPQEVKDALIAIGVSVLWNAGIPSISKKISELTEEQIISVKNILCKE